MFNCLAQLQSVDMHHRLHTVNRSTSVQVHISMQAIVFVKSIY